MPPPSVTTNSTTLQPSNIMTSTFDITSVYECESPSDKHIIHWSDDRMLKEVSVKRFKKILSGRGLVVRKFTSGKAGLVPMMMSYMGKNIYIDSIKGTSVIEIDDIQICSAYGRVLTIKTMGGLETSIMLRSRTDVLAIRNVLGKSNQ